MNLEDALAQLNEHQDPAKAESSAAYHKAPRPYLGVANPIINDLTKEWRAQMDLEQRVDLADAYGKPISLRHASLQPSC